MKSEKARDNIEIDSFIIHNPFRQCVVNIIDARKSVELAEQEMQEKAIEAHRNCCKIYCKRECLNAPMFERCTNDCDYMNCFINNLNNK